MATMWKSFLSLHFLLILLFCSFSSTSSSQLIYKNPVVGLVACRPHQIQALTQFKNEFDTSRCNNSDSLNGVWCDKSTGAVTKLRLRDCLSGTIKPNSSLFQFHQIRLLDLSYNNFSSSLPSEISNLNKLEVLSLASSGFSGQVPPTISNLTRLSNLHLNQNMFTGTFPLVQNLTNLTHLDLHDNHFSGTIPSSLFTMPFLSYLDLRGNHLSGSIEVRNSSISSSLDRLVLGDNNFEGKILEPISNLINLSGLDLSFLNSSYPLDLNLLSSLKSLLLLDFSGNNISPASLSTDSHIPLSLQSLSLKHCGITKFPNIIKSLQNLDFLKLSENRIEGKIPGWLWSLPHLSTVNILDNSFNGFEGSTEVLVNSSVRILVLDENSFEGPLPTLPLSITVFSAFYNSFTGNIPLSICNRSSLVVFDISYNSFTGPIPQCLSNLTFVNLRSNNLEGSLPDMFDVGASPLKTLDVGYNRLSGKLPKSLRYCTSLEFLSVDNNMIKDTFPFWLKVLPNLQVLVLSSNKFYGPISPPHQGPLGFSNLRIFEISDNKFTGSLPPRYFEKWKASSLTMNEDGGLYMIYENNSYGITHYSYTNTLDLQYKGLSMEQERVRTSYVAIDFSGNLLEGQIPESIGLLKALIALNLSNNAFSGHIPLLLANLKELESLDMSRNQLSGTIPNGLGNLSFLAFINVSHNKLTGEIPQGTQITTQSISSFEGNDGLCGLPLQESCFGTIPNNHHSQEDAEEDEQVLNWKGVAIGYGFGVLFGLGIAQFIVSYKPEMLVKIIV